MTAAITAGGRSSRFGSDKAFLKMGEQTLLERVSHSLEGFGQRLLIAPDGRYILKGWQRISEDTMDRGPLGGLEVALEQCQWDWLAFSAVDLPFLTPQFWDLLVGETRLDSLEGIRVQASVQVIVQVIVPLDSHNHAQPLCALYHRSSLPLVRAQLHSGNHALKALLEGLRVQYLPWEKIQDLPRSHLIFCNLNTPEDLKDLPEGGRVDFGLDF
jgi:molybdenum cofactor guanylyltransferase